MLNMFYVEMVSPKEMQYISLILATSSSYKN